LPEGDTRIFTYKKITLKTGSNLKIHKSRNKKLNTLQPFAVIHICKSHKPTHKPNLAKDYACPTAQRTDKTGQLIAPKKIGGSVLRMTVLWLIKL
jgi:hypothetical protein